MKRNLDFGSTTSTSARANTLIWAVPPVPDVRVAARIDDKTISEDMLLAGLSAGEIAKAHAIQNAEERRHFVFRRNFQRVFLAEVLGWQGQLSDIKIDHKLDCPPKSPHAPELKLSFSSTGATVLACAGFHCEVGIDVEKQRSLDDPLGLATRFFTSSEAEAIAKLSDDQQQLAFLHYWTAKEAGLKAIGKGIVSGLNSFVVSPRNNGYVIEFKHNSDQDRPWILQHLDFLQGHVVAFMHRLAI
jgi:phosphopantetheine--protein transferase-like protein